MPDFKPWRQQLHALTTRRRDRAEPPLQARHVLLVAGDSLHDLHSGQRRTLEDAAPAGLAHAAAQLLSGPHAGAPSRNHDGRLRRLLDSTLRGAEQPTVLLLLPPDRFVATTVTLPGVAPAAIPSALKLQAGTLLPGCEEPLTLAVHPGRDPDALSEVALWFPGPELEALFVAFRECGLFLAGVMPRTVAAAAARDEAWLQDTDPQGRTLVHWKNGAIRDWQQVSHRDLEQAVFREQWQSLQDGVPEDRCVEASGAAPYRQRIREAQDVPQAYCMHPEGALAAARRSRNRRRQAMTGLGLAAAMLLAAVPFLLQTVQMVLLQSQLSDAREAASGARSDQAEVSAFEAGWGVLTEFPEQEVDRVLVALQEVISPNVLGRLELEEGYLNIEGQSEDPQRLLQELEEHPLFTEVDFASATSNNRYSIDLRLTTADFPAYYDWYFPESNR